MKPSDPIQVSFVVTSSVHLAALLGTEGVKHLDKRHGPERTPQGTLQVKWIFEDTPTSNQIIHYWQRQPKPVKSWEEMTPEERELVAGHVHAFAGNIRHYLAHTKEKA